MKHPLAALALLLSTTAGAQVSTAPVAVTAKVQSAVTLSGAVALDFGAGIVPGTATTVTPANGGKLTATYNVNTLLSTANSVTLTRAAGGTIAVTLSCAQASTSNAAAPTAFPTDCVTGYNATIVGNAQTTWYLYLGGTIAGAATTTAAAGVYNGNATVTATYTTY